MSEASTNTSKGNPPSGEAGAAGAAGSANAVSEAVHARFGGLPSAQQKQAISKVTDAITKGSDLQKLLTSFLKEADGTPPLIPADTDTTLAIAFGLISQADDDTLKQLRAALPALLKNNVLPSFTLKDAQRKLWTADPDEFLNQIFAADSLVVDAEKADACFCLLGQRAAQLLAALPIESESIIEAAAKEAPKMRGKKNRKAKAKVKKVLSAGEVALQVVNCNK